MARKEMYPLCTHFGVLWRLHYLLLLADILSTMARSATVQYSDRKVKLIISDSKIKKIK